MVVCLCRFATLLGQFHLQKLISSVKESTPGNPPESSWLKNIGQHLCDKSLYALGFCSEFLILPDLSILLNSEAYADKKGRRNKAIVLQKLPHHNLTMEATWPGLFVDDLGKYWDVPLSMAIDLAPVASDSGSSYHLCIQHNSGHPKQFGGDQTSGVPPNLLPGFCVKAAYSVKKDADIWRSKERKLKMVQPFDVFLSDPHVSASVIMGSVVSASFGDNSVRPPTEDLQGFRALRILAQGSKHAFLADLFASVSCTAHHGYFQRLFFDLTRLNARLDFPSGLKFLTGATHLAQSFYHSQKPDSEAVHAICPDVTLSLQQQIVGAFSFRVDSRITFDSKIQNRFARIDESVFAIEYALKVLGSAKAVAWYSTKQREAMVELRFFES
ncbi:protein TRIGALACTOSYLDIACYLGLYCEROL 4, chloroplastic isoform X2 [Magnolia sinica]|uniref:protein TRIGALACTOSYLDIACYLGLYCEROL 4, chloroplastic isoform X2 n=1 Tax=Magnolia sinica TaxID=86752 RepID=UPI0026596AD4|nr:protein TRIGALACTOSYLDIACYLGLYCEROL 4, chloroplastic isoform X2 [Magnolia sinica]